MDDIKINILTRTSNRPNYFKNCFNSVKNQTYKNINHIISVDNNDTEEYVKKYTNNYIRVQSNNKIPMHVHKDRRYAPYNLYLNDLKKNVKDGWIMYLDDDDLFLYDTALEEIVSNIKTEDQLLFWKVQFPGITIPEKELFDKRIIALNHFSMIGFMYNKKYDNVSFDSYSGGDFNFIKQLIPIIPDKKWIDKIYTGIQRKNSMGGFGQKDDLKIKQLK